MSERLPEFPPEARDLSLIRRRIILGGEDNGQAVAVAKASFAVLGPSIVTTRPTASGVPDQPWGREETMQGARNRAAFALLASGRWLAVGVEPGILEITERSQLHLPAGSLAVVAAVHVADHWGRKAESLTGVVAVPDDLSDGIRDGGVVRDVINDVRGPDALANADWMAVMTGGRQTDVDFYLPAVTRVLSIYRDEVAG